MLIARACVLPALLLVAIGAPHLAAADRGDDGHEHRAAFGHDGRVDQREHRWGGDRRVVIREDPIRERRWEGDRGPERREVIIREERRRDRDWDDDRCVDAGGEVVIRGDDSCASGWDDDGGARVHVSAPIFLPPPRAIVHALLALPLLPLHLLRH